MDQEHGVTSLVLALSRLIIGSKRVSRERTSISFNQSNMLYCSAMPDHLWFFVSSDNEWTNISFISSQTPMGSIHRNGCLSVCQSLFLRRRCTWGKRLSRIDVLFFIFDGSFRSISEVNRALMKNRREYHFFLVSPLLKLELESIDVPFTVNLSIISSFYRDRPVWELLELLCILFTSQRHVLSKSCVLSVEQWNLSQRQRLPAHVRCSVGTCLFEALKNSSSSLIGEMFFFSLSLWQMLKSKRSWVCSSPMHSCQSFGVEWLSFFFSLSSK